MTKVPILNINSQVRYWQTNISRDQQDKKVCKLNKVRILKRRKMLDGWMSQEWLVDIPEVGDIDLHLGFEEGLCSIE